MDQLSSLKSALSDRYRVERQIGVGGMATVYLARDLRHAPALVWAALTEPRQLEAWAPFTADRDLASPG